MEATPRAWWAYLERDTARCDGLGQSVANHPEWRPTSATAQAAGADGRTIGPSVDKHVSVPELQRYAHGDIELDDYRGFIGPAISEQSAAMRYASDAEIFDSSGRNAPGKRFGRVEWQRVPAPLRNSETRKGMPATHGELRTTQGANAKRCAGERDAGYGSRSTKYNLTRWR